MAAGDAMAEYVRAKAAAGRLSVSVKMVYKLVSLGKLASLRVGRAVCIPLASLEAYIARHLNQLPPPPTPPAVTSSRRRPPDPAGFLFLPPRAT